MTRATFRPHERILDPKDFRRAFDRRRSVADAHLVVYGIENDRDFPRLGISVSRKKVKTAVQRNRIKRLLREAFRQTRAQIPRGLDLIIVPRGPDLTFAHVIRALPILARDAARRLGLRT